MAMGIAPFKLALWYQQLRQQTMFQKIEALEYYKHPLRHLITSPTKHSSNYLLLLLLFTTLYIFQWKILTIAPFHSGKHSIRNDLYPDSVKVSAPKLNGLLLFKEQVQWQADQRPSMLASFDNVSSEFSYEVHHDAHTKKCKTFVKQLSQLFFECLTLLCMCYARQLSFLVFH